MSKKLKINLAVLSIIYLILQIQIFIIKKDIKKVHEECIIFMNLSNEIDNTLSNNIDKMINIMKVRNQGYPNDDSYYIDFPQNWNGNYNEEDDVYTNTVFNE